MSESVEQLIVRLSSENADLRVRVASLEAGEKVALSGKEIAAKLGVSPRLIERYFADGLLPHFTLPVVVGAKGTKRVKRVWSTDLYRLFEAAR